MDSKLGKLTSQGRLAVALIAFMTGGCSASQPTLFPQRHAMLPSARKVREDAAPLDLPRELDKHCLPAYVVEPGDMLLVSISDLDSPLRLPGDQTVLPDGTISLGRYGRPVVAGKQITEIEGVVQALIQAQGRDPGPITVRLVGRQSEVFYVLGEVNAPGVFPLMGRETVLDGILAAGGLSERASRRDIVLTKPTRPEECRVVLPICYREIVQLGDTTTNYQLQPGDRIFVPSRTAWEDLLGSHHEGPCAAAKAHCGGDAR
jgi:polysaccharide biosynthesis/export protein